jgi:hypothetical protein
MSERIFFTASHIIPFFFESDEIRFFIFFSPYFLPRPRNQIRFFSVFFTRFFRPYFFLLDSFLNRTDSVFYCLVIFPARFFLPDSFFWIGQIQFFSFRLFLHGIGFIFVFSPGFFSPVFSHGLNFVRFFARTMKTPLIFYFLSSRKEIEKYIFPSF